MENKKIKENFIVDSIIYTLMLVIFTIVTFFIEFFFLEITNWLFLLLFRIGSIITDGFLWKYFEKTKNIFEINYKMPKYWSNVFAFILIIQVFYAIRLVIFSSHFNNLDVYITIVMLSSFVIAPLIVWIKEYIKSKVAIIKFWIINKINWIKKNGGL